MNNITVIFKALSDENRLIIMNILSDGEKVYTGFANNSEFNSVYRLELQSETGPTYEYFGTDNVASFENIDLNNKYYSIIYKVFIFDGINYYAIKNFALASGSVEMQKDEEGQFLNSNIKISNIAEKTYSIFAYSRVESDALVEVILSTGETINYNFTKENMKEEIILDLTSYEYNSITIKMTVKCNPYYGMGDIILENRKKLSGQQKFHTDSKIMTGRWI